SARLHGRGVRRAVHPRQAGDLRLSRLSLSYPPSDLQAGEPLQSPRPWLPRGRHHHDALRHGGHERTRPFSSGARRRPALAGDGRRRGRLRRRTGRKTRRAQGPCLRVWRGYAGNPRLAVALRRRGRGRTAMSALILALNTGSSSIKFGVFEMEAAGRLRTMARGTLEIGARWRLEARSRDGTVLGKQAMEGGSLTAGIGGLLRWVEETFAQHSLVACGHRIVHGGDEFCDPVLLTPLMVEALDRLTPLAP